MIRAGAAAVLALAASIAAASPLEVESIEVPNGPHVLVARRAGRRATLVVQFARGSVDDGNRSGVTRLAQHAMLTANAQLDYARFVLDVYAGAGSISLQTELRSSAFVLEADRREFDVLAPKLLRALLAPRLDRARFPGAIQHALHDALEPGRGGGLLELVASRASNDGRYNNEPCGDPDQIELVEPPEVERVFSGAFSAANATVIVSGSFDRDEIVRELRRHSGGTREPVVPTSFSLPLTSRARTMRELHVLAWPLRLDTARDAAVARVLTELVRRVLWERFRETGAAYSFEVAALRTPGIDLFIAALPVRNPSGADLSRYLDTAMADVRAGKFDDVAFERARSIAVGDLAWADESGPAVAAALAAGGASWHGRALDTELRALTRKAFADSLGALLAPERSIALHFGPTEQR